MKRSRLCPVLLVICIIVTTLLIGCTHTQTETKPEETNFTIELKDNIPKAYIGTSYSLASLIIEEEDVKYEFSASYTDPESGEDKTLTVNKGKLTPKAESDIFVTVTATKGTSTKSLDFIVPISISADAIDALLVSDGIAGEADLGVTKIITKEPSHIKAEHSTSAISVTFSNSTDADNGTNLLTLSHYSLHAYYTAQVWRNAAVSFWVYNPMEQNVTFKLSSHNPENSATLLWNSAENIYTQTAIPGQWTQVIFSLYDMNITQPLISSPDQSRNDCLKVLAQYAGEGVCTLYIDGVDIVHADTIPELQTGYTVPALPSVNFSDLLRNYTVYTNDPIATLSASTNGNGSKDAYCFGADQQCGYPTFHIDFPKITDISGFDYLKFDVYAENCYPFVSAAIRYIDDNGETQKLGVSYDFKREQWRTLYLNLHSLKSADLTKVIGISFSVHMDSRFEENYFNCVYFDNVTLYVYPEDEPQFPPARTEDNDLLSAPVYITSPKPNTSGVCKVAADETGLQKSNSTILFWANSVCGYPTATFMFDGVQDWSDYGVLTFETHQVNAHYWMHFEILYLDETGRQHTLSMYHDTVFNHWLTTNAPFEWFQTEDGQSAKEEHLKQVIGFRISVDFANNITDEVAYIFFDNFQLT